MELLQATSVLAFDPVGALTCGLSVIGTLLSATIFPLLIAAMIVLAMAQAQQTPFIEMVKITGVITGVVLGYGGFAYISLTGFRRDCLSLDKVPSSPYE